LIFQKRERASEGQAFAGTTIDCAARGFGYSVSRSFEFT
jgi:hypothetical protein